jgi:AGZA family xanthine/uracil permease-like MFS transporter
MLKKFFKLKEKNTNIRTEIIAGATTFITMAYIIFVNPDILSKTGMDHGALVVVTCLAAAISTILSGVLANAPVAMAPGMGLNAFFAYSLVLSGKVNWETALGVVFLSGVLFLVLTLSGLRKKLVEAIPRSLIAAISVGIGIFITFIGLVHLGLVGAHPVTLVTANPINSTILIGLCGLLVMLVFESRKIPGALLAGIFVATLLALIFGKIEKPQALFSGSIDISAVAFKLDIIGALKWSCVSALFSLMFMDMFDSIGSLVACCSQAKLIDEDGNIKDIDKLLGIDAAATMVGALLGTSTTTTYVESVTGVEQGGRSGLTAVVCGLLFLPAIFFVPLIGCVPSYAVAPALIMVGMFMVKEIKKINFDVINQGFPAFIIIVTISLSYSIGTGLAFGFTSFVIVNLLTGKVRDIKPAMWMIAALSAIFLAQTGISDLMARIMH